MGRIRQVKLSTDLTGIKHVPGALSAVTNYLNAHTIGNSMCPMQELGVWRIQISGCVHDTWIDRGITYIVESKFSDRMTYAEALTLAVGQWDEEFLEDYGIDTLSDDSVMKLIQVKAVALTL